MARTVRYTNEQNVEDTEAAARMFFALDTLPVPLVGRLVTAVFGALAAPLIFVLARALRLPTLAATCAGLVSSRLAG